MASCPDCKRYLETIREYGQAMMQIKKLTQQLQDRPGEGGRAIADRGFRTS